MGLNLALKAEDAYAISFKRTGIWTEKSTIGGY